MVSPAWTGDERRSENGRILRAGLTEIEKLVTPTSATRAEVQLKATMDGKVVGKATFTKGAGWTVELAAGYDLRRRDGQVEARLVWAR